MSKSILLLFVSVAALTMLPKASIAQTCPPGDYNMLDWFTLDTATTQHLTGTANPLYTVLPSNNVFWHLKGDYSGQGYPWDVFYYDSTYIYGWITENVWTDPTTYKAQDNKTNKPLTPICVPPGSVGQKLSSITIPSANTGYHAYAHGCAKGAQQYLGNTVNEIWYFSDNLNIGGNVGTHPDLELSYRYTCDSSYNNCTYKEVYDLMQSYGVVRWTYYVLQSDGTYQQENQSIFNDLVSGGAPSPYFPCGLPQN